MNLRQLLFTLILVLATGFVSQLTSALASASVVTFSDVRISPSGEISFVASDSDRIIRVEVNPSRQTPEQVNITIERAAQIFSKADTGVIERGTSKGMCIAFSVVAGATVIGSFYFLITRALNGRLGLFDSFLLADGVIAAGVIAYFGCRK